LPRAGDRGEVVVGYAVENVIEVMAEKIATNVANAEVEVR
jgi:hypothetical protein